VVRADRAVGYRTGMRHGWGARQEVAFTHPAFRFHAERVIRKIVGRCADHPAVIGFQVDNEPGLHLFHNHGVFQRFTDDLRERYGDVETLNREWGLVYWSHRLSTWADLWTPRHRPGPAFAKALLQWVTPAADTWHPAHPSVTSTSARSRDGHRVRFLHNWSWEQVTVPVPEAVRDVLSGAVYTADVPLGPWDVKVLQEQ
jgi:beta-galactosidase GanA